MTISSQLLDILVCPVTKQSVSLLGEDKLEKLNQKIKQGKIKTQDGKTVAEPLTEALITSNRNTIYRIQEGIPVMLEDQGIDVMQLESE